MLIPLAEALGARLLPRAPAPTMSTRARRVGASHTTAPGPRSIIVVSQDMNPDQPSLKNLESDRRGSQELVQMVPTVSYQWLCDCAASFQVLPHELYAV